MKKHTIIYFLLLLCISCVNKEGDKHKIREDVKTDEIVLIFDSLPSLQYHNELKFPSGIWARVTHPILTFKPQLVTEELDVYSEILQDTLVIKTKSDYVIANYRYNPIDNIDFLIENGDTVLISIINQAPLLKIKNRGSNVYDLQTDSILASQHMKIDRYAMNNWMQEYSNNNLVTSWMLNTTEKEVANKYIPQYLENIIDNKSWLDSVQRTGEISDIAYKYFDKKIAYQLFIQQYDGQARNKNKSILALYNDSIYHNDNSKFYKQKYQTVAEDYCIEGKQIISSNSRMSDYLHGYKQLQKDSLIYGQLKEDLKVTLFTGLVDQISIKEGRKYYKELLSSLTDTLLIKRVKKEFATTFDNTILDSKSLELQNVKGDRFTFENILDANKGKIVYVDFWASWCVPCLREMPEAKKLREKYAEEEISFIYLAIYDKEDAWQKAISKADLKTVTDNYLILNSKTAPLLKQLNVKTIPRFLLYDKQGQLAYKEAPSPSSKNIYHTIDKLLKK